MRKEKRHFKEKFLKHLSFLANSVKIRSKNPGRKAKGRCAMVAGTFKQEILKVYNNVNRQIFNTGVRQQNVEFVGDKIIIFSLNTRVPALKLLDSQYAGTTDYMDHLLTQVFKKQIKTAIENRFHLNVIAVFKDYDAASESSGTILCLDRDVEAYLNELPEL